MDPIERIFFIKLLLIVASMWLALRQIIIVAAFLLLSLVKNIFYRSVKIPREVLENSLHPFSMNGYST